MVYSLKKFVCQFMLIGAVLVAKAENSIPLQKLQSIPDLTYEALHYMPSLLLTSSDDNRIDRLAKNKHELFLIKTQGKDSYIIIVDPNNTEGILWWKKKSRNVFALERWMQIIKNESVLNIEEINFFKKSGF